VSPSARADSGVIDCESEKYCSSKAPIDRDILTDCVSASLRAMTFMTDEVTK
jgi:hypothetical protein